MDPVKLRDDVVRVVTHKLFRRVDNLVQSEG